MNVKLDWVSNFIFIYQNFPASLSIIETCVDTYDSTNQEIYYPSFNPSLEMEADCSWKIVAPIDKTVILTFNIIEMDPTTECDESYIQVFDGSDMNATRIGKRICGSSNLESLESIGRDIYVAYSSIKANPSDRFRIGVNMPGNNKED